MLLSTIACDLAARFPTFRASISKAIEEDPSLASAGFSRQFGGLIGPFASALPQEKPIVLVLDALDEGFTKEILDFLLKSISGLPRAIQMFLTTRDVQGIKQLFEAPHVHHKIFIHGDEVALQDVRLLTEATLKEISKDKGLGEWPTEEVVNKVVQRSGGLMIWVVTVCQYLKEVLDPKGDLEDLLEKRLPSEQGAEEMMDELYATVLMKFQWRDRKFAKGYEQVMGTILASKVPLSPFAIESLQSGMLQFKLADLLHTLKPLLHPSDEGKPIQILHQSLHDFLTDRALKKDTWKHFAINEQLHSQQLALLCIQFINEELTGNTPGTGYLHGKSKGIPRLAEDCVAEHLLYACRFWMDHLLVYENPSKELIDVFHTLLEHKISLLLELSACIGKIKEIGSLITWIEVSG